MPDVIKGLRALPLGNFIAFPAEIIRTGFNIINMVAMKELLVAEGLPIKEIGVKRIRRTLCSHSVLWEMEIQQLGMKLTGTSQKS